MGIEKKLGKIAKYVMKISIVLIIILIICFIVEVCSNGWNYGNIAVTIQTVVGLVALMVAAESTKWLILEPEFSLYILDQHDSPIEKIDGKYIPLGLNARSEICYLPYSPRDWEIDICNVGKKVAKNVKILISIDGVSFRDKSHLYSVRSFEYGYGDFRELVFETKDDIKINDFLRLPKIPFQYAESEFVDGDKTQMHIHIISDEKTLSEVTFDMCIVYDETALHDDVIDELIYDRKLIEEINAFLLVQDGQVTLDDYYLKSPYECNIEKEKKSIYRQLYNEYAFHNYFEYSRNSLTRRLVQEKMKVALKTKALYWGRLYYRALGLSISEVELVIKNEID